MSGKAPEKAETFEFKGLRIDLKSYEVTVNGRNVNLSPTEFKLLRFLSQNPGRVYSRDQILDQVWGDESYVEPRTVDVHIRRLRAQIEPDESSPDYIVTVRGAATSSWIAEPPRRNPGWLEPALPGRPMSRKSLTNRSARAIKYSVTKCGISSSIIRAPGQRGVVDRRPHPAIGSTQGTLPTGPTSADFRFHPRG